MQKRLEPLGKYKIFVSEDHSFGTDSILLADFASNGLKGRFKNHCDLGTGCGIIPMLMLKDGNVEKSTGVEIQAAGCKLAEESAHINGISDKFRIINADLKYLDGKAEFGAYDLVTCNPPYKAEGSGIQSNAESQKIARHETLCSFDDIVKTSARLLKFSGRLCICHRPERLADIFVTMRKYKIEPKRLRTVIQREKEEPWLVLVEGRLGGKSGMRIMPPLFVEENGRISAEMMIIYGDYKEGFGDKV